PAGQGEPALAVAAAPELADAPPPPPPTQEPFRTAGSNQGTGVAFTSFTSEKPVEASAMTSLVSGGIGALSGVAGFCCCVGVPLSLVAGLTAVIFGHMARSKAGHHAEAHRDRQYATLGLIL